MQLTSFSHIQLWKEQVKDFSISSPSKKLLNQIYFKKKGLKGKKGPQYCFKFVRKARFLKACNSGQLEWI